MRDSAVDKTLFGFWIYILSDCVLFAGLFATYAVLRGETFGGVTIRELVSLKYVLMETVLLLTSSFTMGLCILSINQQEKRRTLLALAVTLILGLSFVGLEFNEFGRLLLDGKSFTESAFLSSYFTLVGTHGLHVMLGSLWMLVLMVSVYIRGLTIPNIRKLLLLSLFWHFLDIVWIFIFTFVYLLGML